MHINESTSAALSPVSVYVLLLAQVRLYGSLTDSLWVSGPPFLFPIPLYGAQVYHSSRQKKKLEIINKKGEWGGQGNQVCFLPMIFYLVHVGDVCVLFVWEMGFVTGVKG